MGHGKGKPQRNRVPYDVSGSGDPVLLISTGPIADSFLPLVSEPALARSLPLDPVPSATNACRHQRPCAGELRAARGRRGRAARPPRHPSRPCRRSLDGGGHRPPIGGRPARDRSHAGPAGTATGECAQRWGLLREGGTGARGVRCGRPRRGDGGVPQRRAAASTGKPAVSSSRSTSRAVWRRR